MIKSIPDIWSPPDSSSQKIMISYRSKKKSHNIFYINLFMYHPHLLTIFGSKVLIIITKNFDQYFLLIYIFFDHRIKCLFIKNEVTLIQEILTHRLIPSGRMIQFVNTYLLLTLSGQMACISTAYDRENHLSQRDKYVVSLSFVPFLLVLWRKTPRWDIHNLSIFFI